MKTRVALIIPTMDRGGAERQVCLLAAGLPRNLFDVHVVLLTRGGPRESELIAAQVPYTIIGKSHKFAPKTYFELKNCLREFSPHIVHTFLFAANSYGRMAAHSVRVPVIIGSERCVDPWKTWYHRFIDRKLARVSAAMTTNSNGVVEFYEKSGLSRDLFTVIPNGIESTTIEPLSRDTIAKSYGIDTKRRWIGAVGRLWPQKRYRDLIWAAEMLNTLRGDDTTLVIVGDGPQLGELQRHRDAVSNPNRILFVGARSDVAQLLPHLDAFWLASGYEGQSNALMEAMQVGRLCIASNIPGNRDLITHDSTGVLVEVGDAADFARQTQHCWTHPEFAAQLGQAAAARIASDFSVERMIARHSELYSRLLCSGSYPEKTLTD
jgi:glycosyltransferase involved in cell wall biosynthesis